MASKDWVSAEKQDKNSDQIEELIPKLRFNNFHENWQLIDFMDVFNSLPTKKYQIKSKDIKEKGKFIVVDQGKEEIAGYFDDKTKLFNDLPIIIYGDHTTIVKFKDEPFIVGADGVKLLNSKINANLKYLYYALLNVNIKPEGYKRHFSILKKVKIPISNINEQTKIANFLSLVDKKIELMEKTLFLYERFAKEFIKNIYLNLNTSNKVKLRDIVDSYISSLSISNLDDNEGEYPLYGAEGVVKYINFYEMKNQYISIIKDGAGVGRLNLCNQYSSALGTLQCLIPKKEFDLHFIYYYLKNLNFKKYIVGSTIPHIYFNDYSKEKLNIPPLDIQRKYGKQCLTLEMKKKIIENAIISLKQYKKYLLQNLFI